MKHICGNAALALVTVSFIGGAAAQDDVTAAVFKGSVIDKEMFQEAELGDPCFGEFSFSRDVAPMSQGGDNAVYMFAGTPWTLSASIGASTHEPVASDLVYGIVDDDVDGDFFQLRATEVLGFSTKSTLLQFAELSSHAFESTALPSFDELANFVEGGEVSLLVIRGASFARCLIEGLESPADAQ